eukprot:GHRQ01011754.1.p1 GENE.GHRQ01011754.1~~GHRQ01011754.1.p1  ORF type:complete len:129 (+),score=50.57 GHRQ01011754.1:397-783(+)
MLGRIALSAGVLGRMVAQQLAGSAGASAGLAQTAAASSSSGLLHLLGSSSRAFATNSHDIFNIHKHSPDNNWNTDFDFTPANYKKVGPVVHGSVRCGMLAGVELAAYNCRLWQVLYGTVGSSSSRKSW